jgi:hypothetical protein
LIIYDFLPSNFIFIVLSRAYAEIAAITIFFPSNLFFFSSLLPSVFIFFFSPRVVLAYAEIASLPVQYGLYSSYIGILIYTLMGTSKDITLGPTAVMSLLVGETLGDEVEVGEVCKEEERKERRRGRGRREKREKREGKRNSTLHVIRKNI